MDTELRKAQQDMRIALAILERAERRRNQAIVEAIEEGQTQQHVADIPRHRPAKRRPDRR